MHHVSISITRLYQAGAGNLERRGAFWLASFYGAAGIVQQRHPTLQSARFWLRRAAAA